MRKNHAWMLRITLTGILTAMNVVFSSFSIPLPVGHLYLNDIVICTAAILLGPWEAFVAGGIGAFLGDFFFYPVAMYVSVVVRGLQAVVISLLSHYVLKKHPKLASGIGVSAGAVIMVVGYTVGRVYFYGEKCYPWAASLAKLPVQTGMAVAGAVVGMFLCWTAGLRKIYARMLTK